MKTPLSQAHFIEPGRMIFPFRGCLELNQLLRIEPNPDSHAQVNMDLQIQQRDNDHSLCFAMCEVCNIQLNTQAQAQVHYNGRSHLKRVKQMNAGEVPPSPAAGSLQTSTLVLGTSANSSRAGSSCHSNTLPALVRTPSLMMQPTLDMKPFMPFHQVDTSSAVGLFPNFNTMDPVQKAVINHTFGVSIPPKKKQVISCNICQLRFNSDSQAEAHYKGSKHAKKVKAQDNTKNKPQKSSPPLVPSLDGAVTIATTSPTHLTSPVTTSNPDQAAPAVSRLVGCSVDEAMCRSQGNPFGSGLLMTKHKTNRKRRQKHVLVE
ncbi:hypothetical protein DPEC_G00048120 [Dallia pectoralis]|uniref:Uncharacterized protein n=1 Tax=Dallia pectoralis TaxID=75939 RepID=A0ACC2HB04_DALPE|nr:hypothetical protein DPEC_G00048120 [Dallia pectoralis]